MKFRISDTSDIKNWEEFKRTLPELAAAIAELDPTVPERFGRQAHTTTNPYAAWRKRIEPQMKAMEVAGQNITGDEPDHGFQYGARERLERGVSACVWPDAALAFGEASVFYRMEAALMLKELDARLQEEEWTGDREDRILFPLRKRIREMDEKAEHADRLMKFAAGRTQAGCPLCGAVISYRANERGMVCEACDAQFTVNTLSLQ